MKKIIATILLLTTMSMLFCSCGCEHEWSETSCLQPSVCGLCGEEREASGHVWEINDCTILRKCIQCNFIEEKAIGHSTRLGICSNCEEYINDVEYKDGFAVVTKKDTKWMKEKDDFVDIFVVGLILEISPYNDIVILDSDLGIWTIDLGTACDLSGYIGTECSVYGFSSGGISSQHDTPLINMNHDNNRIVFVDGRSLYPESFESTQQFKDKYVSDSDAELSEKVWISNNGGTKYHSKSTCSNMKNPKPISLNVATSKGYTACQKCH